MCVYFMIIGFQNAIVDVMFITEGNGKKNCSYLFHEGNKDPS